MPIAIKEYYYGQTGASTIAPLSGTAGALITLLDSVLLPTTDGFNKRTVSSISVTNNVATATTSVNHGYAVGEVVAISGCDTPTYAVFNDDFTILSTPALNTFTYAITTGLNNPTGTIISKYSSLGWEKKYSTTNIAAYHSLDNTGTGLFLRVDDTNAQYAKVTMYETMSGVSTGTGASSDFYWKKSDAYSASTRNWWLVGNTKTFYLFVDWNSSYLNQPNGYAFGDFVSLRPSDAYRCMLIGYNASAPSYPYSGCDFYYVSGSGNTQGHTIARSHSQIGSSISFFKMALSYSSYMGYAGSYVYPNPVDNGIHLSPVYIWESTTKFRGYMPGLYCPFETTNGVFLSRDKTVVIGGRTYMAMRIEGSNVNTYGNCWLDMTGPWT